MAKECRTCSQPVESYGSCAWCARTDTPLSSYFTFRGRFAKGERERYEQEESRR